MYCAHQGVTDAVSGFNLCDLDDVGRVIPSSPRLYSIGSMTTFIHGSVDFSIPPPKHTHGDQLLSFLEDPRSQNKVSLDF